MQTHHHRCDNPLDGLGLHLPKLLYRADQSVWEVAPFAYLPQVRVGKTPWIVLLSLVADPSASGQPPTDYPGLKNQELDSELKTRVTQAS